MRVYTEHRPCRTAYHTWATPDGRKTGRTIADAPPRTDAATKRAKPPYSVPHVPSITGNTWMGIALYLRITMPESGCRLAKLRDMTTSYFYRGGMEVHTCRQHGHAARRTERSRILP
jgi:formate C-acetyltransferase